MDTIDFKHTKNHLMKSLTPIVVKIISHQKAIFLGIGMPNPTKAPIFNGLSENNGFWTSKDFLPKVSAASKECVLIFE